VARTVEECRHEARERLRELRCGGARGVEGAVGTDGVDRAGESSGPELDEESLVGALAVDAVVCALGIGRSAAAELVELSARLGTVLPDVLKAWESGVLDSARVRVLARSTEVLDDDTARRVVRAVMPPAGDAPWNGLSPRSWRAHVERAVVRPDRQAAARRRAAAVAARRVRSWAEGDGTAVLQLRAELADVALADQVVTDLARAWPAVGADGVSLTMDQRRADALTGLFRAVRDGSLADDSMAVSRSIVPHGVVPPDVVASGVVSPGVASPGVVPHGVVPPGVAASGVVSLGVVPSGVLPRVPVRRVHDLGLVLHADTLLDEGPAADEPAQLRALGQPTVVDPVSARSLARRQLAQGSAVQVLVVDSSGALEHVVRLQPSEAGACRSRATLLTAVRRALRRSPELSTRSYEPTEAITRHVRADAPTCTFYDCPRQARSCDLDHDTPWPRGPTSVRNLDPKCRRHHNLKTTALVTTRLLAGPRAGPRTVQWRLPGGLQVTTTPEPLPGVGLPGRAMDSRKPDDAA
jgi:hypothetical protein